MIEAEDVARRRGAVPYAEVLGYARDVRRAPHGPAAARRRGGGPRRHARARGRRRRRADEIDWVSAHASSTPIGDIAEARALAAALGDAGRDRARQRDQGPDRPPAGRDRRHRGGDGRARHPRRVRPGHRNLVAPEPELAALLPGLLAGGREGRFDRAAVDVVRVRRAQRGARPRGAVDGPDGRTPAAPAVSGAAIPSRACPTMPPGSAASALRSCPSPPGPTDDPDRLVIASTESGSTSSTPGTGDRRAAPGHRDPVGVLEGRPTRDGTGVVWFHDETGRRDGQLRHRAVRRAGRARAAARGAPRGVDRGAGDRPAPHGRRDVSTEDGFSVWVGRAGRRRADDPRARRSRSGSRGGWGLTGAVDRAALSATSRRRPRGDGGRRRPAPVAALDRRADRRDRRGAAGPGPRAVAGYAFSPIAGDPRIAITHERTGEQRPALWDARTGDLTDLPLDLEGDVEPADWWPDGVRAAAAQLLEAAAIALYRYDLATGALTTGSRPEPGSITAAGVRPDGDGLVPRPQRHAPGAAARGRLDDAAARGRGRRAPRRAARSSRGGSRTRTASASTASWSARTATVRTP